MSVHHTIQRISKIANNNEREVGEFLSNLGFEFIDANSVITNSLGKIIGEIDLIFTFESYLFLVEVTKEKSAGGNKKIAFFSKWSEDSTLAILRKKYHMAPRKVVRLYFDLNKHDGGDESPAVQPQTQSDKLNKIIYLDDYEYFVASFKKIGIWAKNDFLDWLEIADESKSKEVEAIQYYIGDVPVFCFVERVDNLLHACYVSRRRTRDKGYQRTLNERRVANIANNIKKGEGLLFPNSILINTTKLSESIASSSECPKTVKIHFPISYCRCRIIDGQHRLLGFSRLSEETQKTYFLPVIAVQEYDQNKEVMTFIDINSKQQRIDNNLILLLKSDFEWNHGSKEFKEKIGVGIAFKLNESYFKNRIYFGMADEPKGNKITLVTLVSAMVNNNQVGNTLEETYDNVAQFFSYMQQYMPDRSFRENTYFGQNRGIRVLFRLLNLLQRNIDAKQINVTREIFCQDLSTILDTKMIENLDDYYGEGGANAATKELIKAFRLKVPTKYGQMKTDLKSLRT